MNTAVAPAKRILFRSVLFATDFSPASEAAMPSVADVVQRFDASRFLAHPAPPEKCARSARAVWPAMEAHLQNEAKQLRETLSRQFLGITDAFDTFVRGVWGAVEKVARDKIADLIVAGTRGRMIAHANCLVLTVRASAERSHGNFVPLVEED